MNGVGTSIIIFDNISMIQILTKLLHTFENNLNLWRFSLKLYQVRPPFVA